MDLKLQPVVLEVSLDLLAIHIVDIHICDGQHSAPMLVAVSQLGVFRVENSIEEGEVVGDSLVAINMEAILCLNDRCSEVRHVEVERAAGE